MSGRRLQYVVDQIAVEVTELVPACRKFWNPDSFLVLLNVFPRPGRIGRIFTVTARVLVVVGLVVTGVVQSDSRDRRARISGGDDLADLTIHRQRSFEDNRAETGDDSLLERRTGTDPDALSDP